MSQFIQSVDDRTRMAGANRLEVLLFSLGLDQKTGREEVFGINVFKVREVLNVPEITRAPDAAEGIEGMVSLRGVMVPVIKLAHFCQLEVEEKPGILIISEYNKNLLGLLVHSVEHILRMEWSKIKAPPPIMANRMGGLLTAVTELDDGRISMILDVEKVLALVSPRSDEDEKAMFNDIKKVSSPKMILFADDSSVARKQISQTLDAMGVKYISAKNGLEAWEKLKELADRASANGVHLKDHIQAVLTDVEMPEMDGYVLTKNIKEDARLKGIPVVMHSSLSADANVSMGKAVGADFYVPKFNPEDLSKMMFQVLGEGGDGVETNNDEAS